MTDEHPYSPFLHQVQKPSRYLGGEHGQAASADPASKKNWDTVGCRMCLAFPDVYEVGMSHLGFKILYSLINAKEDLIAERAYAPWLDMEEKLRQHEQPLRSLESWHALSDFDVVGFSLQFELTYTNVLQMLDLGGIPLRSADRGDDDPLVLAGGPSATHPEPLADFIDAFLIGDGEARTVEIMQVWQQARDAGLPRAARLERLAALGGVYVPAFYETEVDPETGMQYVARSTNAAAALPIKRAHVEDLSSFPFPKEGPIANTETVFDRISVEIARGCTEGCRFCQAGMIYRPVREREPQEVVDVIDHAITHGGYDGASLTCLSTADYSAISPLIHTISGQLKKKHATLSVASLRAYGLDEDVLDKLRDTGSKGLTFAPEAGTQRMRDVVNKNVTEEQLMETAKRVFERGWSRMKLYFMIGLPTEEDDDVRGIAQTGDRAYAIGRRLVGRTARITVNVSTHVPKPHTPFQWCAMDSRRDVLRKQALLREEAGSSGITLRMHASAGSWVEGVLSRGDRSLCDAIEGAYRRGARFDSWDEALKIAAWDEAFKEAGIDVERFLGTIPVTAHLPWEHLDVGLEDKFLVREYRRALRNRLSPPCGKALGTFVHQTNLEGHDADTRKLICYNCGVACDMTHMRDRRGELLVQLGALTPRPVEAPAELPAKHRGRRRPPARADQGEALRVRVRFEKLGRGAYGSHLDLVRLVPRLLRRLELPIYYSKGFKQKPVMAFGPALPLGMFSLSEYIDLKLVASTPIDYATLPEQLSISSIEGVRFIEALPLGPGDPKLNRVIDEAVYVVGLPRTTLDAIGVKDEVELAALIEERQAGELVVRREIEGVVKQVDVGHYLRGVSVGEGHAVLERAGLIGELIPVTLRLAITATGSARATEALDVLLGVTDQPARIVRSELLFTRGNVALRPLQLDEIRESLADGRQMDVAR